MGGSSLRSLKDLVLFQFYFFRLTAFRVTFLWFMKLMHHYIFQWKFPSVCHVSDLDSWVLPTAVCRSLPVPPGAAAFLLLASPAFSFWIHWRSFLASHDLQYPQSKLQLHWEVWSLLTEWWVFVCFFLSAWRLHFTKFAKICHIIVYHKKYGSNENYSLHLWHN